MNELVITIVTSVATLIGTVLTVVSGNKLIAYRIQQLEEKVKAHNNFDTRIYEIEKHLEVD